MPREPLYASKVTDWPAVSELLGSAEREVKRPSRRDAGIVATPWRCPDDAKKPTTPWRAALRAGEQPVATH